MRDVGVINAGTGSLVFFAAVLLALIFAIPAQANTSEQDRQFLAALRSAGWTIKSADVVTTQARMVCNEGLGHGVTVTEMHSTLQGWGYSSKDAATLIAQAVKTYCPQYTAAVNGFDPSPSASAGPTYADGDAFALEVHKYGILRNLDPAILVSTLGNICYQAKDGTPKGAIVSIYMDGWGLTRSDATWLINAATARCS